MRKKIYVKAKNVQNFTEVLPCVTALLAKFTDNFGSHFIARGHTNRSES